ncbi:MAG: aldehyde dehydrogenase [Candidatus Sericytochromatia bacterium]|nr:MAG: aldehyde dehydrogenase [Candidatus Sericytochromatia bacterium]
MALLLEDRKTLNKLNKLLSINPGTLEIIGELEVTTEKEIKEIVEKAKKSFKEWASLTIKQRCKYMKKVSDYIMKNLNNIAELISKENGKPFVEAITADIMPTLELIDYVIKNSENILSSENINLGKWNLLNKKSYIEYEPLGVIGIISPWNFPFSIPMGQIVMALTCGNCVILKHSEHTPFIGLEIEKVFKESGLPQGVFSVITGHGLTGSQLVSSGLNKIVFTGSVSTGKKVMETAAKTLTPVVLELGGKDPMIVLKDVNIDYASSGAVWGAFTNSGQVCASIERVYVHEDIADEFIYEVVKKTSMLKQGIGLDKTTDVGAMISLQQLEIVENHVNEAKSKGAKILIGGQRNLDLPGYFYKPTVLTKVDDSFKIVTDETFGPVMPIMTFKNDDEAIEKANNSIYGLSASIWTKDIEKAKRIASKLQAGSVNINDCLSTYALCQTPWGGYKESGIGRTHGKFGFMEFVQPKHIHVDYNYNTKKFWWYKYSQNTIDMFENFLKFMFSDSKISSSLKFLEKFSKNKTI